MKCFCSDIRQQVLAMPRIFIYSVSVEFIFMQRKEKEFIVESYIL